MYKLLIVDDERMITDLLFEYLQNKLESELELYKTYSGRNAIEIMENTAIDILITDINMPGVSGLELHRRAKELNPQLKVIFLTGYNDFGHIQYALRNESVDFILKIESNEVIYNSIHKAITELNNELDIERIQQQAKHQLNLTIPILWERLVLSLLDGEDFDPSAFEDIAFPLATDQKMMLMMGWFDEGNSITKSMLFKMKNTVDEYIRKNNRVFSVIEGNEILWMIQPADGGAKLAGGSMPSNMDTARSICLQFGISLSLVLSNDFIAFSDVSYAWHGLRQTIKNLYGLSHGMLLVDDSHHPRQVEGEWLYVRTLLQRVKGCIENLQREKFDGCYQALIAAVKDAPSINYQEKLEIVMCLYLSFLSHFNRSELSFDFDFVDYFKEGGDWDSYDQLFGKMAEDFFAKQQQKSFKNTNQILGGLKKYIQANLGGDTSLSTLAGICHFSPSYLSRIFKQVTNQNITEYIGRLKFEKAASLLISSDIKIVNIARELGFDTQSYFTRFFKKHAGLGPQEYRDKRIKP